MPRFMPQIPAETLRRWRYEALGNRSEADDSDNFSSRILALLNEIERMKTERFQPHQRAALGSLGAAHGSAARDKTTTFYRAKGCDCEYCSAFEQARTVTKG